MRQDWSHIGAIQWKPHFSSPLENWIVTLFKITSQGWFNNQLHVKTFFLPWINSGFWVKYTIKYRFIFYYVIVNVSHTLIILDKSPASANSNIILSCEKKTKTHIIIIRQGLLLRAITGKTAFTQCYRWGCRLELHYFCMLSKMLPGDTFTIMAAFKLNDGPETYP